jgi:hypothetical protein
MGSRESRPTAGPPLDTVDWSLRWRDGLGAAVRPPDRHAVVVRRRRPLATVVDREMAFGTGSMVPAA